MAELFLLPPGGGLDASIGRLTTALAHPPEWDRRADALASYRRSIFDAYYECRLIDETAAAAVLRLYLPPERERMYGPAGASIVGEED